MIRTTRQEANPHNRFHATTVEWEEGVELPQALRIHEETAKSIITSNDSPDIPFRFSVNPYRGCAHACAYCYARPTHEYLGLGAGTDFDTQIYAKVNAAELLRKKLASPSWEGEGLTFSGVTDCYQPAEHKYRLTRACLEACRDYATPVSVITKSTLVLRDLDVLTDLHGAAGAGVVLSVPVLDPVVARLIEPFAPPPDRRFKAMEKVARAGLPTGISLGPVIPGLTDSDIPALLSRARDAGATFAFYVMLRLPGAVREVFLERVRHLLPDRAGKIEHHIQEIRGGGWYQNQWGERMSGSGKMADMISQIFAIHARRLGLGTGEALSVLESRPRHPRPEMLGQGR
ncbi:MAG TPA: PA0069 family radical SAM protein, partial [Fibrobacteria bacterium]|nr:PA0069 family radical SAM protein [Fibrobacteria bacterium]